MTIHEILDLPAGDLSALSDEQLDTLLGPLIPATRQAIAPPPDVREAARVQAQAIALLKAMNLSLPGK